MVCADGEWADESPTASTPPQVHTTDDGKTYGEGDQCAEIGQRAGPLVCAAAFESVIVPDVWIEPSCYINGNPVADGYRVGGLVCAAGQWAEG